MSARTHAKTIGSPPGPVSFHQTRQDCQKGQLSLPDFKRSKAWAGEVLGFAIVTDGDTHPLVFTGSLTGAPEAYHSRLRSTLGIGTELRRKMSYQCV